jgi:hypothetical protein
MPIEYAILIVAVIYLVSGIAYVEWIHRPRKPDQTKPPEGGTGDSELH